MPTLRRCGGLLTLVGVLVASALGVVIGSVSAAAAATASVTVTPAVVGRGGIVTISGAVPVAACPVTGGAVILTSTDALFPPFGFGPTVSRNASGAFSTPYTLPASAAQGTYGIGLRCGGGNVGVPATLQVTAQAASAPTALANSPALMKVFYTTTTGQIANDYWTPTLGWNNQTLPGPVILIQTGVGTMIVSPSTVNPDVSPTTLTFTYTAASQGLADGQVALVIPADWPAPSTTNRTASGYTTLAGGGQAASISTSGQSVTVHGLTMTPGQTLTITYGNTAVGGPGITTPGIAEKETFSTSEAASVLGTPMSLSTSLAVRVQPQPTQTTTFDNWSGYLDTGDTFTSVTGSWFVPTAQCSATGTPMQSSAWVGIGDGNPTLEQLGTESDCNTGLTGGPNYFPWYEMLGVPSINDGAPVDFSSAGECTGAGLSGSDLCR